MVKLIKSIQRSRSWVGSPGATSRAVCNWKSEVDEEARSAPGSCSQDDSAAWLTLYCPQCWRGWTGPDMTLVLIHNFFSAGFVHWYQRAQTWQDIAFTEWKRQKGMHGNEQVIVKFNPIFQVPIYSIHSSPTNSNLFCTSGRSNVGPFDWHLKLFCFQGSVYQGLWSKISWAWGQGGRPGSSQSDDMNIIVFSLFFLSQVYRHCPTDLRDSDSFKAYITCAVFSGDGQEVVIKLYHFSKKEYS